MLKGIARVGIQQIKLSAKLRESLWSRNQVAKSPGKMMQCPCIASKIFVLGGERFEGIQISEGSLQLFFLSKQMPNKIRKSRDKCPNARQELDLA